MVCHAPSSSSSSPYSVAEAAGGGHGAGAAASLFAVDQRVELGGTAGGSPGQRHVTVGHSGEMAGDGGVFQPSAQQDTVPLELLGEDGVQEGVGARVERQHEDRQHLQGIARQACM